MASINNITVKNLKGFYGHEGEPLCQGNLYVGSKKVAFWSMDSHGGPDNFAFAPEYSEIKLDKKVIELNKDKAHHGTTMTGEPFTIEYDLEHLITDVMTLLEDEKIFKKAIKKGYQGIVTISDRLNSFSFYLPAKWSAMSDEDLYKLLETDIEKEKKKAGFLKESEYRKHTYKVYRSAADFKIGTPITLKDILR